MSKIKSIKAKEILDSRGNPTVEVELISGDGKFIASVPSGASTGKYEAVEQPVSEAVRNIDEVIAPELIGKDPVRQQELDNLMIDLDATENKSKLGANAILPVSIVTCRAGAANQGFPLYQYINQLYKGDIKLSLPCFNIINGGVHAENDLDIQEFMVVPQEDSFSKNLEIGKDIYKTLGDDLGPEARIGDEGGFAPLISETIQALDFLVKAIKDEPKVKFGLDCAATQFFLDNKYKLEGKELNGEELRNFYQDLTKKYPIIFIEDPFAEEDWKSWKKLGKALVIGDDLTVTNKKRVEKVIKERFLSGIIVKPNQVGTLTETLTTAKTAQQAGLKIIVSHRSGETLDDFIADLAVAIGADFIKSGAPQPKERMAKYNRLLEIEKELIK